MNLSYDEKRIVLLVTITLALLIPAVFNVTWLNLTAHYVAVWEWIKTQSGTYVYLIVIGVLASGYFFELPHSDLMRSLFGYILLGVVVIGLPIVLNVAYISAWYDAGWGWVVTTSATFFAKFKTSA